MEFFGRYVRQRYSIFLQFYPQLWYSYYINDYPYQGNFIPFNAKTDGFYAGDAEDPTFNERSTRKV